ncbi:MAG: hypothetical protein Q7S86_05255, partial [bacterium]|nr:hypothetical protein [bacterium]
IHTPMEISNGLQRQMDRGKSTSELATALGQSVGWVYHHLSLQKLAKPLQTLLGPPTPRKERIRLAVVNKLVRVPVDEQEALYLKIGVEKNPKRQSMLAQELVETLVGVSRQKSRGRQPSDEVDWLTVFAPRLDADVLRLSKFATSVYQSLLRHREPEEIGRILSTLKKASETFNAFETEVERIRTVVLKKS